MSSQIGVALPLNTRTEDGLPTPEENKQLDEVEDHITRSIQQSKRAVVHTHEVQVMVQPDPQWTVFKDFT